MKGEKCYANNETISQISKSSKGGVANSLTKLEKTGYIRKEYVNDVKTKREEIIPLVVFRNIAGEQELKQRGLTDPLKGLTVPLIGVNRSVNHKNIIEEDNLIKESSKKIARTQKQENNEEFVWADYLNEMLLDTREHIRFIARFFKFRDLSYSSKKAAIEAISRFSRIASKLVKTYSEDELQWAAKYCKNAYSNIQWTPDTMLKALTSGKRNSDGTTEAASFGRKNTFGSVANKTKSTKYDNIGSSI